MAQVDLDAEVPGNFWESRLITDELMRAAQVDPSLWPDVSQRIANFDVNLRNGAIAWQESAQIALKHVGKSSGFPTGALSVVVENVGTILTDIPRDAQALGIKMAQVGVGIAMGVLAPIPIVGQIAAAVGAIAQMLLSLAAQPVEAAQIVLPPLQDYSDEVDEWVVNNQILPASSTLDWTGLFMPRFAGPWKAHGRQHGVAMMGATGGAGAGFWPGTQRLSSAIQTYWGVGGHFAEVSPELATRSRDTGSFYPGASQLMTALAEQCAKPQTQMYNLDTVKVLDAWETYFRYAIELAGAIYKREAWAVRGTPLADQTLAQNQAMAQAMMSPLLVGVQNQIGGMGTATWTPDSTSHKTVLDVFIRPWCEKVRRRQWNNLGRLVGAAYTTEEQGAFRDHELLVRLRTMRALLLSHPARHDIISADVIDPAFRSALFDVTVGQTLTAAAPAGKPSRPIEPGLGRDPNVPPPGGGVPFGRPGSGGKAGLVLFLGALLGLGYVARRKRWI